MVPPFEPNLDPLGIGVGIMFVILLLTGAFIIIGGHIAENPTEKEYNMYINFTENIEEDMIKKDKVKDYNENELFKYCQHRANNISDYYFTKNKVKYCNKLVNNVTAGES